jgi:GNAT superfamily N-acetyltransferase
MVVNRKARGARATYARVMETMTATSISIAPANLRDLVPAAELYQRAVESLATTLQLRVPWPTRDEREADLRQAIRILARLHETNPRNVVVARADRTVVGMAAVLIEGDHAHLAYLFVDPTWQEQGIGASLLDAIRDEIDRAGASQVTLASSRDPRAWHRYLRWGLHPGQPQLGFRSDKPAFPTSFQSTTGYTSRAMTMADLGDVASLDRLIRGVDRSDQLEAWLRESDWAGVVLDARDALCGFAYVTVGADSAQAGPIVGRDPAAFAVALDLALFEAGRVANPHDHPWRVDCSARNVHAPARLLEAGFRLASLVNWFETNPIGMWDLACFRNEDEL